MKEITKETIELFFKIADNIFHPLKDLPVPDFNNIYDDSIL